MSKRILALVGLMIAALGLVTVASPSLVPMKTDQVVLTVIGTGILLQAAVMMNKARQDSYSLITPGFPETPWELPTPGDELQATFESIAEGGLLHEQEQVRDQLREVTANVLAQTHRISLTDAKQLITDESWTSDAAAARYLTEGFSALGPLGEVTDEVKQWISTRLSIDRTPAQQQLVIRTVNAISHLLDMPPLDPDLMAKDEEESERFLQSPEELASDSSTEHLSEEVYLRTEQETGHWNGVGVVTLVFTGVGIIIGQSAMIIAGVIGLIYAGYARLPPSDPPKLRIDRTVEVDEDISPGELIPVTVEVRNEGERLLADLRVIDGVPPGLSIAEGSPRMATTLPAGDSKTIDYKLKASRGRHEFWPTKIIQKSLTGAHERELLFCLEDSVASVSHLQSTNAPIPLREYAAQFVGNVAAQKGGGMEFHSVREYLPGDPIGRIDWNRHARTGEITTIEFREERAAKIVLLIDTRAVAYLEHPSQRHRIGDDGASEGYNAVDRSIEAAGKLFTALLADGNSVGLTNVGPTDCWLPPSLGSDHAIRAARLLSLDPAFSQLPPSAEFELMGWFKRLVRRLSEGTQIVYFTPLSDEYSVTLARQLDVRRYPVTVVSPNPTEDEHLGERIAYIQRRLRITRLRRTDIPVVDWDWEQPLEAALRPAVRRHQ